MRGCQKLQANVPPSPRLIAVPHRSLETGRVCGNARIGDWDWFWGLPWKRGASAENGEERERCRLSFKIFRVTHMRNFEICAKMNKVGGDELEISPICRWESSSKNSKMFFFFFFALFSFGFASTWLWFGNFFCCFFLYLGRIWLFLISGCRESLLSTPVERSGDGGTGTLFYYPLRVHTCGCARVYSCSPVDVVGTHPFTQGALRLRGWLRFLSVVKNITPWLC